MVDPRVRRYLDRMSTSTFAPSLSLDAPTDGSRSANPFTSTTAPSAVRSKALAAAGILVVFGAYSVWVLLGHGVTGLVTLVRDEPWALQLLLDLVLSCSFAIGWLVHDARRRSIAAWPFVIATLAAGSIGLLGYVAWRGAATPRQGT